MKIDLVYLWCNGSDPVWRNKRQQFIDIGLVNDQQTLCAGRIADNSDLRYSLRSVDLYAPWINHIYVVTDNQCPEWLLDENPKISIVNQNDLFESKYLPLYNSCAIELGIHKIKGLSEHYIYANDDMMLGRAVSPDFLFTSDGKAKCRFVRHYNYKERQDTYHYTLNKVIETIVNEFGAEYDFLYPHHQIDAYVKSSVEDCVRKYDAWVEETLSNNFRSPSDMQRHMLSLFAVATDKAVIASDNHSKFIKSLLLILRFLKLHKGFDSRRFGLENKGIMKDIKIFKPALLCFNDSECVTGEDRDRIKEIYKRLYPIKSQFEK